MVRMAPVRQGTCIFHVRGLVLGSSVQGLAQLHDGFCFLTCCLLSLAHLLTPLISVDCPKPKTRYSAGFISEVEFRVQR